MRERERERKMCDSIPGVGERETWFKVGVTTVAGAHRLIESYVEREETQNATHSLTHLRLCVCVWIAKNIGTRQRQKRMRQQERERKKVS